MMDQADNLRKAIEKLHPERAAGKMPEAAAEPMTAAAEPMPVAEQMPLVAPMTVAEQMPVTKPLPAAEPMPVAEQMPLVAPMTVAEQMPVTKPLPAAEPMTAAAEPMPVAEQMPARAFGPARVVAVASGRDGVGKAGVCANLALALADADDRVLVVDLRSFVVADKPIREMVRECGHGIGIISADAAREGLETGRAAAPGFEDFASLLAQSEEGRIGALLSGLPEIDEEYDFIIINAGPGMSESALAVSESADCTIVIATPEPAVFIDAYAFIKALAARCRETPVGLIVNKAENGAGAERILNKLWNVADKFLDLKIHKLGYILNDPLVVRSNKQRQPFFLHFSHNETANCLRGIRGRGMSGFFGEIMKRVNIQANVG